jgi:hypothetical protein
MQNSRTRSSSPRSLDKKAKSHRAARPPNEISRPPAAVHFAKYHNTPEAYINKQMFYRASLRGPSIHSFILVTATSLDLGSLL